MIRINYYNAALALILEILIDMKLINNNERIQYSAMMELNFYCMKPFISFCDSPHHREEGKQTALEIFNTLYFQYKH